MTYSTMCSNIQMVIETIYKRWLTANTTSGGQVGFLLGQITIRRSRRVKPSSRAQVKTRAEPGNLVRGEAEAWQWETSVSYSQEFSSPILYEKSKSREQYINVHTCGVMTYVSTL